MSLRLSHGSGAWKLQTEDSESFLLFPCIYNFHGEGLCGEWKPSGDVLLFNTQRKGGIVSLHKMVPNTALS